MKETLQYYKDYVRAVCTSEKIPVSYKQMVLGNIAWDLATSRCSSRDYADVENLYTKCVKLKSNENCGVIGKPDRMLAYARLGSKYIVMVYNLPADHGWIVQNTSSKQCALSGNCRSHLSELDTLVTVVDPCDPVTIVSTYLSKFQGTGMTQEYLRLVSAAGLDTLDMDVQLLASAFKLSNAALSAVANVIQFDLSE